MTNLFRPLKSGARWFFLIAGLVAAQVTAAQTLTRTGVLVIGGGTGGIAAGIQSARMGVPTVIVEEGPWLGGMLTAAGVSAIDGNHAMPSGIWGEFRSALYLAYGGPDRLATGWVSETMFEPHVGDSILKAISGALPNLAVLYRHRFVKAITEGNSVTGAEFLNLENGALVRIMASQTIDATELGDVMASAGVPCDLGMEASVITGEGLNIPETNDIVQDLTYTAILKDYGPAADCTIVRPDGYDPKEFDCCCRDACTDTALLFSKVSKQQMLNYGRLPHGKYMLNWPSHGNDIYLNIVEMDEESRQKELLKAKLKTLRFVYFIQTRLGYRNLGLADDEFPTADRLPLVPYYREGRRLNGMIRFKVQHIAYPFADSPALYRTGIAVGDYPVDHHHRENPKAPQHLGFYPVPSYNVPLGALIPAGYEGLIVAEKGISVSNAANGTTRLQPVVMLTGQAAGALAGLCISQRKNARFIPVRDVQSILLASGAYIMPYYDVHPSSAIFRSVQKIGATGILRGRGEPHQWANRTWFYPDSLVETGALARDIAPFMTIKTFPRKALTIREACALAMSMARKYKVGNKFDLYSTEQFTTQVSAQWPGWGLKDFRAERCITRAELAVLLDRTVDPFTLKQVNHSGQFQ